MRPKEFFRHLTLSLIPHRYRLIAEKKFLQGIQLYGKTFVFGLVILFFLFIPTMHMASERIVSQTEHFDNATLAFEFQTNQPITVLERQGIYIDSNASKRGDAMILMGDGVIYRQKLFLFGEKAVSYDSVLNVQENPAGFAKFFRWLTYLILPGFVMLIGLLLLTISQALAVFSAFITRLIRKGNTFRDYYVVSLHAQLMPLLIFLWSIPFINFWWLSLLLYFVIYVLAVMLLSGYKFKSLSA